jgi:uncharacterized protein YjaZ
MLKKERGMQVTIAPTQDWLTESLDDPLEILKNTKQGKKDTESLYRYLIKHGMYRPSPAAKMIFQSMKEKKIWDFFAKLERKYRYKWDGPNVPIYLLPIHENRGWFQTSMKKSGVCFKDEIYLFLKDGGDNKEYEALFAHEYHHCVRMAKLNKNDEEYTLLDSIVFEGLAEYAVKEYCGEKYVASWTRAYENEKMSQYYKKWIKPNLKITRIDPLHDQLLLGQKNFPKMLGYAAGYYLVNHLSNSKTTSTIGLIGKPSSYFLPVENVKADKQQN